MSDLHVRTRTPAGRRNQHRAVERGDTLRILEKHAGLKSAPLVEIRRQQVQEYNEAVRDLHAGKAVEGFAKLERIGFIQQIEDLEDRHAAILQTFLELKELKHEDGRAHTVLIAAPTHAEIHEVTSRLRAALQQRGIVSAEETKVARLESLDLTEAQKRDELAYRPGLVIEPHFQITGAKKSEQLEVISAANGMVKVRDRQGNERELRLAESAKWSLYERQTIGLAVGDQVRVTKNHLVTTDQAGEDGKPVRKRLTNGDVLRVQKIECERIHLERNGKPEGLLDASKGLHLTYGYVITSNAAQGKTVDWAIPSLPVHSLSVATRELFYVLCSRARYGCKAFTDSKTAVKEAIQLTDYRMSAHDLLKGDLGERVEALKARAQARETTLRTKRAQVKLSPSESMGLRHPEPGPLVEYMNVQAMNGRRLSPSVQQGLDRLRRWSREQASGVMMNRRERIREVMLRRKRANTIAMEKCRKYGMAR
ncbi:MAG: AAA family ATPase [Verrucomicrobia bacterium]|nr:AAA family ATPase [Verrucomicrobiota bacterium]